MRTTRDDLLDGNRPRRTLFHTYSNVCVFPSAPPRFDKPESNLYCEFRSRLLRSSFVCVAELRGSFKVVGTLPLHAVVTQVARVFVK